MRDSVDLAVVGAGPAGLVAAISAARRGASGRPPRTPAPARQEAPGDRRRPVQSPARRPLGLGLHRDRTPGSSLRSWTGSATRRSRHFSRGSDSGSTRTRAAASTR
ncbi:MAG: NAD(P)/FAD-dependent oxidoreductase [Candidatus Moduliflexus flocculans]|nr:NAD(P)/FAD-dependent oxidoreductase [Candidatus Moduliflexus flocculans]